MKRIFFLILMAISTANKCSAMANNAKINPALAAANKKLQPKPMVFFNTERLKCEIDQDFQKTRNIKKTSRSHEMNDSEAKLYQVYQEYWKKNKALDDKQTESTNKYNQKKISADAYNIECKKISDEREQLNAEFCANINKLFQQQQQDVLKKITVIAESIAKRLGACGVASYAPAHYQMMGQIPTITCVDPAYDITDEVYDTLNKEYKATKGETPKCNHCGIHCPHK